VWCFCATSRFVDTLTVTPFVEQAIGIGQSN
jgi:hypothetical protein